MIRNANSFDISTLKKIWKDIFKDDTPYISLFFDKVVTNNKTFIYEQDGIIKAMLYYKIYRLKINSIFYTAAYISGIAVLNKYRGAGIMRELLNYALTTLESEKIDFAFLIPATNKLFSSYAKFGFCGNCKIFFKQISKHQIKEASKINLKIGSLPYSIYLETTKNFNNILLFDEKDVAVNDKYIKQSKGNIIYYEKGFCYYYFNKEELIIKECFVEESDLPALLWYFKQNFDFQFISIYSYYNYKNSKVINKGMVKALNNNILPEDIYMNMMLD